MKKTPKEKFTANFETEIQFYKQNLLCVGTDEVGRGCLAGPVVAASVQIPAELFQSSPDWWNQVGDSKTLSAKKREELAEKIKESCVVSIALCEAPEIDQLNILHASLKAMRRSLDIFTGKAQVVLVDGHIDPYKMGIGRNEPCPFKQVVPIVKGDAKSLSIAAASIVAKVYRDQLMEKLGLEFPQYEFAVHKGYPTPLHKQKILEHGINHLYRRSFSLPGL